MLLKGTEKISSYSINAKNFFVLTGPWDPGKANVWQIFQCNLLCLEQISTEEETQIAGVVAFVDMTDYSMWQARHVTYSYAKSVISLLQVSMTMGASLCIMRVRYEQFHFMICIKAIWRS